LLDASANFMGCLVCKERLAIAARWAKDAMHVTCVFEWAFRQAAVDEGTCTAAQQQQRPPLKALEPGELL
jgi:hypothetical protein